MSTILAFFLMATTPLALPDGKGGIGFDDLRYDAASGRLLIPAGRTGSIDLIDPATKQITPIGGFSKLARYDAGHSQSVTSVDAGAGLLFATDRTALKVAVIDPSQNKIVSDTPLADLPDYVRYVASTREVWVTQPGKVRIEIFSLAKTTLSHTGFIDVPGGPESLAIDEKRGRAFTHLWKNKTVAIDVRSQKIAEKWAAGCDDPRGIWADSARGLVLVGCDDGTAVALDVDHGGRVLSHVKSGQGVDIIAYDGKRGHLYLPGEDSATMAIIGVTDKGLMTILGQVDTVRGAHCVTSDDHGQVYVCDPRHGQLLVVSDPY